MADRARPGDIARAIVELATARLMLRSDHARRLAALAPTCEPRRLDRRQTDLVNRIAYVIPRAAARLPWRTDCLVQALAAERWLRREGIASTLTLGVPREKPAIFEAHAWLTAGDRIVTGGDVSGYTALQRL